MDASLKKEKPAILDLYIPPPPAVPYSPRYVSLGSQSETHGHMVTGSPGQMLNQGATLNKEI